jgi:hypothetical protein
MHNMEAMQIVNGMAEGDEIEVLQALIDSGLAWTLEGSVGRACMACIEAGDCLLGEVSTVGYYGQRIPSRYDVEPGSLGSVEYAEAQEGNRW